MKRTISLLLLFGLLALLAVQVSSARWTIPNSCAGQQHNEIKIDPKSFDDFVGQYSFPETPDFFISFWREGDRFFLQATNQRKIEIFPESENIFFLKIIDAQATFLRDAKG